MFTTTLYPTATIYLATRITGLAKKQHAGLEMRKAPVPVHQEPGLLIEGIGCQLSVTVTKDQ
jgi:hypothetical protein